MSSESIFNASAHFQEIPGKPVTKWKIWYKAFENYLMAIYGKKFEAERKKAILYGLLGVAGQEIFESLPDYEPVPGQFIPLDEFQEAVKRLEKQFDEEENIMVGRHRFALRKQLESENVEEYIGSLRVLATKCDFGDMADMYIHDQFVFHCFERKIQERLLACKKPTLSEVVDIAKGIERSLEGRKELAKYVSDVVPLTIKLIP
ncbi:uncharacterized protein LOC144821882 [Lissotriton helveticus]